jgi:hypothetical protein
MAKKSKKNDGSLGLSFRTNKAGERKTSTARNDQVSERLSDCGTPSEVAEFAMDFGITQKEIKERVEKAPNFGQFRMVIGNRIRGIVNRVAKAKEKGTDLSLEDAAYPKTKTVARGAKAPKPPKKKAKSKGAKSAAKPKAKKKARKKAAAVASDD